MDMRYVSVSANAHRRSTMSVSQSCTRVPTLLKLDILQGLENAELAFNTVLAADSWLCRWHVVFVLQFWAICGHDEKERVRLRVRESLYL